MAGREHSKPPPIALAGGDHFSPKYLARWARSPSRGRRSLSIDHASTFVKRMAWKTRRGGRGWGWTRTARSAREGRPLAWGEHACEEHPDGCGHPAPLNGDIVLAQQQLLDHPTAMPLGAHALGAVTPSVGPRWRCHLGEPAERGR